MVGRFQSNNPREGIVYNLRCVMGYFLGAALLSPSTFTADPLPLPSFRNSVHICAVVLPNGSHSGTWCVLVRSLSSAALQALHTSNEPAALLRTTAIERSVSIGSYPAFESRVFIRASRGLSVRILSLYRDLFLILIKFIEEWVAFTSAGGGQVTGSGGAGVVRARDAVGWARRSVNASESLRQRLLPLEAILQTLLCRLLLPSLNHSSSYGRTLQER